MLVISIVFAINIISKIIIQYGAKQKSILIFEISILKIKKSKSWCVANLIQSAVFIQSIQVDCVYEKTCFFYGNYKLKIGCAYYKICWYLGKL